MLWRSRLLDHFECCTIISRVLPLSSVQAALKSRCMGQKRSLTRTVMKFSMVIQVLTADKIPVLGGLSFFSIRPGR